MGGDKWVKSKTVRWTPQGCLVGKYKPFGNFKKKFSLKKKPQTVRFYKYVFTLKKIFNMPLIVKSDFYKMA